MIQKGTKMHKGKIPDIVFLRMSQYLRIALSWQEKVPLITSSELGRKAGLPAARVRNDFHYFGELGLMGKGYDRNELIARIKKTFGLDRSHGIFLAGYDPLIVNMLINDRCTEYDFKLLTELDIQQPAA